MSKPTLAEQAYIAFRSNSPDPAALPAWGNLDTDSRIAWAAAADRMEKVVTEQCAVKLRDAAISGRHADDGVEGATDGIEWAAQYLRRP